MRGDKNAWQGPLRDVFKLLDVENFQLFRLVVEVVKVFDFQAFDVDKDVELSKLVLIFGYDSFENVRQDLFVSESESFPPFVD